MTLGGNQGGARMNHELELLEPRWTCRFGWHRMTWGKLVEGTVQPMATVFQPFPQTHQAMVQEGRCADCGRRKLRRG